MFRKVDYELINSSTMVNFGDYEDNVLLQYRQLLINSANDEKIFQNFFERNPALVPGAFGFLGESGHAPYNISLITQPLLQGLTTKIPDFLWIATDSCTIYPVFIEIERPNKKWFTAKGTPSADFTQAQNQLSDWKLWYSNPLHQQLFYQYYDIVSEIANGKTVKPLFVLIYGSRSEFDGKPELNQKRAQLTRENEFYMTFDRLTPNRKAHSVITSIVKNGQYIAKFVAPTFNLGPVFAKQLTKITNIENAIHNSELQPARKDFLISRLPYWVDFGKKGRKGLLHSSDWE